MQQFLATAPEIIREAAKSPFGLFALMLLILAVLALYFVREAGERTRIAIFVLLVLGVASFAVVIFHTTAPPPLPPKQLANPGSRAPVEAGSPEHRKPSNSDCFAHYFQALPKDRVVLVEEGSTDVNLLGPDQTPEAPIALQFTEQRMPIGAITFTFFSGNQIFKVDTVVDGTCHTIAEYRNSIRGGDKHVLQNWDTLEMRLGHATYTLRLGYDGGNMEANYFRRIAPATSN